MPNLTIPGGGGADDRGGGVNARQGGSPRANPGRKRNFFSSLFLVPKKDRKTRQVVNLKRLNVYIPHQHFKMEGIHTLRELLRESD